METSRPARPARRRSQGSPYSLGKLIEWKRGRRDDRRRQVRVAPYSLGKLIEWKQGVAHARNLHSLVPTR